MTIEMYLSADLIMIDGQAIARLIVPEYQARHTFNSFFGLSEDEIEEKEQEAEANGRLEGKTDGFTDAREKAIKCVEDCFDALDDEPMSKKARAMLDKLYAEVRHEIEGIE